MYRRLLFVTFVLSVIESAAWSQESPPEPKPPPVTKVELREAPDLVKAGKVAIYRGEADKVGVAFYLEGLGIATPVGMMLRSGESSAPMTLHVKNDLSENWDRKVEPNDGVATTRFRTEGPAMALVSSAGAPAPYELVIWVGPDLKIDKATRGPFVTQEQYDKAHPGGSGGGAGNVVGIVAGIAIAVAFVVLMLYGIRRARRRAA